VDLATPRFVFEKPHQPGADDIDEADQDDGLFQPPAQAAVRPLRLPPD
jgi:hypothetical protein